MGYCFMKIDKLSTTSHMNSAYAHNLRKMDVKNASKELAPLNEELVPLHGKTYSQAFEEKIRSLEYYKNHQIRSNGVRALEVMLTFSPSEREQIDLEQWKKDNVDWLRKSFNADPLKYGDNVISVVYHGDEAGNVHCHGIVIPVDDKGHLNAHYYTGGSMVMRQLQNSYGELMKKRHNLDRGMENSKATHEDIKKFYSMLNKSLERNAPGIQPEETLTQYKARVDAWAKDLALKDMQKDLQHKRELAETATREYNKHLAVDVERKKLRGEVRKMQKEKDGLIHEFGEINSIKAELTAMQDLKEAFRSYPDEEERERVRKDMNSFIQYGHKQRMKRKKKERAECRIK